MVFPARPTGRKGCYQLIHCFLFCEFGQAIGLPTLISLKFEGIGQWGCQAEMCCAAFASFVHCN